MSYDYIEMWVQRTRMTPRHGRATDADLLGSDRSCMEHGHRVIVHLIGVDLKRIGSRSTNHEVGENRKVFGGSAAMRRV